MRLDQRDRREIAQKMIVHRMRQPVIALAARLTTLATDVYQDLYGEDADRMCALPQGWLPQAEHFQAKFGKILVCLYFNGIQTVDYRLSAYLEEKPPRVVKQTVQGRHLDGLAISYPHRHPRSSEFRTILEESKRLVKEADDLRRLTLAQLGKFQTVASLIKRWPEAARFVEIKNAPTKAELEMPISKVNEKLAL